MESYVIRIYRRDKQGVSPIRGVVEEVGTVGQEAFGTKEELWNILSDLPQSTGRNKPGKDAKNKRIRKVRSDVNQDN